MKQIRMPKLLGMASVASLVSMLSALPALAQDAAAAAAAAAPATPAPVLDAGNTAWMLTSTALVLMMTIPGLALFYGGMVRKKNVLATIMQSFAITCLVTVLWFMFGYSLAFSDGGGTNAYIGGFSKFFHHGITVSTLRFPSGVLAVSMEDVWSGPREEGFESDIYIKWRVEGTDGVAQGTIGWPDGKPSTLRYASKRSTSGRWAEPSWSTMWFPQAFIGVMEQLQYAVKTGSEPVLSVADNVRTMALVEAGYRSMDENRPVKLAEFPV